MAENSTSAEYNLDENSDCEGYKTEDTGDNESIVPGEILKLLHVGFSEVSSDHTDFGDEWDDNEPNTVNFSDVTTNANIPNWTTNFIYVTIEPFTQESGPSLPENFDVSVATALDYLNLLFKPEIFSDIRTTKTIMPSSNKKKFRETEIILS